MKEKRIFHIISNTHWDREWRFPFQKNRQMLVEMIDKILEILEQEPEYRAFHLDSQTIVIEDFLSIRPEKRPIIQKFVREKRLLIGPWFILPDEFQVGGESLIRNLLLGHRIASEFGHVMKVGYSPFSWGQISQFPQIYQEFGIDVVMFYRGINSLDSPKAEFIWEGADGTRVLASRFSTMPRYNFYFYIYRPVIHNEEFSDIEYQWTKGGLPFHFADDELKEEDYNMLQPLDNYYQENLQPAVEAIINDQANDFTTPHIFWAEGHDSSGPNIKTVQIIQNIKKLLPDDEIVHSTLEQYAQGLKDSVNYEGLMFVQGERRSTQYDRRSGNFYGHTTSARMYLKQMNFKTEKWLQFYAEPFNVLAGLLGLNIEDKYLDIAWHLLLQNSAHDSIGGCSLDEVHDDMMNRYKQCQEIAKGVFVRACKHLAQNINLKNHSEQSIHLVAINPTTYRRNEVAEAFIDIPADLDQGDLKILDHLGHNVDFQILDIQDKEPVLEQMIDRPMYFKMRRYHCYLYLKNIPSLGFSTWHINPTSVSQKSHDLIGRMENDLPVLENKHLNISINRNGTINVFDKETGTSYSNPGYFFDEGEAGHAWVHQPVPPFFDTQKSSPKIELALNGPLIAICSVHQQMEIPATLVDRKNNGKKVLLPIELNVILKKDSHRVEFEIKLNNAAECHRLRIMFPLGINAKHSFGEGQFDVVARPIDRPDTSDWLEQPMYDYPMHHFVGLSDD
ncbi:MAG TPA: glycoside hydrolase family 38 C-terminal domain-containing protein [bacterium]